MVRAGDDRNKEDDKKKKLNVPKEKEKPKPAKKRSEDDVEVDAKQRAQLDEGEVREEQTAPAMKAKNVEMYFNFLVFGRFGYIGSRVVSSH